MSLEGLLGLFDRITAWADRLQRKHGVLGFPYAVIKKYGDDAGARQAALITYYGFLSIFPLLLLGVAILSRVPRVADGSAPDWCLRDDRRHVCAVLQAPSGPLTLHDFYVPAGGDVPDPVLNPKYAHKLAFVDEVIRHFAAAAPRRSVLVGDLNIAPGEHDVWSHRQLLDVVSHTPPEVERMEAWLATGFVDAMRHVIPAPTKLYSWWSYRNRDWRGTNRGRRLDHVWVTPDLLPSLRGMVVLEDARDWPRPSDHVPVAIDLDV